MAPPFASEAQAIAAGATRLTGHHLRGLVEDTTVWGEYRGGFRFVTYLGPDGRMEGRNHAGAHDHGHWSIDPTRDTLTVRWRGGWVHTTTHACLHNGELHLFDADTGRWRNSFQTMLPGKHPLVP